MSLFPRSWKRMLVSAGLTCAVSIVAAGCGDTPANSGTAYPNPPPGLSGVVGVSKNPFSPYPFKPSPLWSRRYPRRVSETQAVDNTDSRTSTRAGAPADSARDAETPDDKAAQANPATDAKPATEDPARPRTFVVEGPADALRISFVDLDLMKLINMDPVTADCVEKMPEWLRQLDGKQVRIRGYMKPSGLSEGIPQFVFVRSTDLCCFGPKGKVYHLIAVKLKDGTTTDYIELKPFDVTGKFRIEKVELDDGLIFLLYHIDDAAIIRK